MVAPKGAAILFRCAPMDVPISSYLRVWEDLTPLQQGVVSQRVRDGKTFDQIARESGRILSNVTKAFYSAKRKASKV